MSNDFTDMSNGLFYMYNVSLDMYLKTDGAP
jgi:hypothetical protein